MRLQIPPKLEKFITSSFFGIRNLVEIEVSPKNKFYSYIDNKYLVGKSDESKDVFDILYYARYDIEEAVIPPQIEILQDNLFNYRIRKKYRKCNLLFKSFSPK